jgi:hypothetical protein
MATVKLTTSELTAILQASQREAKRRGMQLTIHWDRIVVVNWEHNAKEAVRHRE